MDVKKIGVFLAQLRKEEGWTQEQLGQQLGVTNKTVSRWENRNYMPPAEMLLALSKLYDISINEILSGQRLTEAEYHEKAEENIKAALESSFSLQEKMEYFKCKWRKEHRFEDIVAIVAIIGIYWAGYYFDNGLQFIAILLPILYHGLRNNRMMTYVESHAFDRTEKSKSPYPSYCHQRGAVRVRKLHCQKGMDHFQPREYVSRHMGNPLFI